MTPERWRRIKEIAGQAMDLDAGERAAFLIAAAGNDVELLESVEKLLRADAESGNTIERAIGAAAAVVGGSAEPPEQGGMVGRRISHYHVVEKIGEGGMGVVYKAHDTKLDRPVALKFLSHGFGRQREKSRFLREAQAAAALNHPNICPIHEIDEFEGQVFFAMAFIEGRTVDELAASRRMPIDEVLDIAIQTASGLEEAHELQIVHRDIKSPNIIVNAKGRAAILDFGLAQIGVGSKLTKTGTTLGTAAYMSPEQASGSEVDARSDIWSLGVVIYEMATGELPFDSEYSLAILYSIVNEEPVQLDELRPDAPAALADLVARTLAKKREDRYQTVAELLDDLRGLKQQLSEATPRRRDWSALSGRRMVTSLHGIVRSRPWLAALVAFAALTLAVVVWRGAPGAGSPAAADAGSMMPGAQELYSQGLNYLQRYEQPENLDTAISLFKDALKEDPNRAAVHAALGQAYWRKFMSNKDQTWLEGALNSSNRAVDLDPESAQAYATSGLIKNHRGQPADAVRDLERALELNGENVDAVRGLAGAYHAQGRTEEAEAQYKRAIRLAPADWTGYKSLGVFYYGQDRYREAEEQFRAVVRLTPDNAAGHSNLGAMLDLQGRADEAARSYEKSISLAPSADAYSNLGTIDYFRDSYSDAVLNYTRAIEIDPNRDTLWGNLGDAYRRRAMAGDEASSEEAYLRAIELARRQLAVNPADGYGRSRLAFWLACVGKRKDADSEIQQALSLEPDSARVLLQAAVFYEFVGDRARALGAYDSALAAGSSTRVAGNHPDLRGLPKISAVERRQ